MHISKLIDVEVKDVLNAQFDLAIFASGYESRCISLAEKIVHLPTRTIILGFEHVRNPQRRRSHDEYFLSKFGRRTVHVPTFNDEPIYQLLSIELGSIDIPDDRPLHVLIDYSSMTRTWYAAIVNWFRFGVHYKNVTLTFCYCPGMYSGNNFPPLSVEEVVALPGFEGRSATLHKSVAIFGLGFESLVPLSLLDKLQPDQIYSIIAANMNNSDYVTRAIEANTEVLALSKDILYLPLTSVSTSLAKLSELLVPYQGFADITYIPVGPKPHVLAGLLLSVQYEDVTVLHIRGDSVTPEDVLPNGALICTHLELRV